jgi:hypothetical protein
MFFARVQPAGTIHNAFGVENEEEGAPIWVATAPRQPLPAEWPSLRHYD